MNTTNRIEDSANRVIDCCDSTNVLARLLGDDGFPHGTWVSSRKQAKGRGRLGREWLSSEGGLFISMIARIDNKKNWTWVPLAAAVAVVSAIKENFPMLNIGIKWPNDIIAGSAKLGGILCEGFTRTDGGFIVVGIGVNCADFPANIDQPATSLREELKNAVPRVLGADTVSADTIRSAVLPKLYNVLNELQNLGPRGLRARYEGYALLKPGKSISWQMSGSTQTGEVKGVGEAGELMVCLEDGSVSGLFAEDVTLLK